jgi:transcriptional regulator with XRE-family HTH domain
MSRTHHSPRHQALAALLVEKRKKAGLTQAVVAMTLGRQSFVATVESGQHRIDVIEHIEFASAPLGSMQPLRFGVSYEQTLPRKSIRPEFGPKSLNPKSKGNRPQNHRSRANIAFGRAAFVA